jgi:hypothetical protein
MSIMKSILIGLLVFTSFSLFAQENYTISGKVTDASTGEDIVGAAVAFWGTESSAVMTNTYGFYSITLPEGSYSVEISSFNFNTITDTIVLNRHADMDYKLEFMNEEIEEVVVTSERKDKNITSTEMSVETLDIKKINTVPVLFGEKDILKTIQLLPGISTVSEGSSGFSVRGGSTDQNLILLDEAPVYSASHLLGFFSVFNSDALKDASVYKGGIPANYGGRASSVLDIIMKDGNNQNFAVSGGIGLISSRLTVEGPIVKDKSSFIISGRRSYADLVAKGFNLIDDDIDLYFYDLNAKFNYKLNDKNRIFISGYFGKDDFGFEETGLDWGNTTGTFRWNHLVSNKMFSNTTFIYSNYDYSFNLGDIATMSSGIEDWGVKQDFTWYLNPRNTMDFGLSSTYHTFNPGELDFTDNDDLETILDQKNALESAVYFSNDQKLHDKFSFKYGIRLSMFNQIGEGTEYTYDDENNAIDSTEYEKGEFMQSYFEYEPRISMSYRLNKTSSVKASYNRMAQYLHLLSNSTSGQPTDTWVPSSNNIKPLIVSQVALGYFRNFDDNNYEFSVEAYYKDMQNVTDYEDGSNLLFNEDVEASIISGKGRSYGAEFYLKKSYGKFTGWVSYTLAKTEKLIDGVNNNEWYETKYDKTHDLSIVASYQFTKRINLSANFVYYTGNAVTFPSGTYYYDGTTWPYYTERNGYRMPDYHRLDLNFQIKGKERERFESSWDFSIYNVYHRYNAYTISFQESEAAGMNEAVKLSLFGIVPSITYNFKF